jgi:hypothetical protein
MRKRTAQNYRMKAAGRHNVADILAASAQKAQILDALERTADQ